VRLPSRLPGREGEGERGRGRGRGREGREGSEGREGEGREREGGGEVEAERGKAPSTTLRHQSALPTTMREAALREAAHDA
jgi:hypothetical protein